MICFITCRGQQNNLRPLLVDPSGPRSAVRFYDDVLSQTQLPRATYVFTATALLSPGELNRAARLFRRLQENGCRVLNDPARVRTRLPLLQALYRAGMNSFNAFSAEEEEKPKRFPVFVRISHGSRPPLSDLIWDQVTLQRAIEEAITVGLPRQSLMIVEYAAEPVRPGVFRKGSVYRIGNHFVPDLWWYGTSWIVKGDEDGLADEELCAEELQMIRDNSYAKDVERAFDIGNVNYGRLDFGLVNGKPCIYEINLNPELFGVRTNRIPQRAEGIKLKWRKLLTALHDIDTSADAEEVIEVEGTSIQAMTKAADGIPTLRFHHLRLSEEHERRGNIKAALKHAEAEVAANPDSAKALSALSRLLARHNRVDDAIKALKKGVEVSPRQIGEQCRLATLLWKSGRFEEMQQQLRTAMMHGIDDWQVHLLFSRVCRRLRDDDTALEAARRAVHLVSRNAHPRTVANLIKLSRILRSYGCTDDAIAVLQLAVHLFPNRGGHRRRLASQLIKAGRFEDARDHLLVTRDLKEHWKTYYLLSRVYGKLGDKAAAFNAIKRATELAPDDPVVSKRLQMFLARTKPKHSPLMQWRRLRKTITRLQEMLRSTRPNR
jgi:tetratricopeptide (TPR) repeat protein